MAITVIGVDGASLPPGAASLLEEADLVVGGRRHLDRHAPGTARVIELGPLAPALAALATEPAHSAVVVLASGDPGFFGVVRALAESERPLWSQMSFSAAEENFHVAAQHGIEALLYWPGLGEVSATELVLRRLLPLAREGLESWGAGSASIDRLLGIIEQRCVTGRNGAEWFVDRVRAREEAGAGRPEALREVVLEYRDRMHSNDPVHAW